MVVGIAILGVMIVTAIGASSSNQKSGLGLPRTVDQADSGNISPSTITQPVESESGTAKGTVDSGGIAGDEMSSAAAGRASSEAVAAPARDATIDLGLKIIRNGSVDLLVKKSNFDQDVREVERIASRYNGYVSSSSRSGAGKDARSATVKLRVPAAKFDAALDDIRGSGGKVVSLSMTSDDVTSTYVDSESRLRHAQAVEGRLLTLLAKAKTVGEALSIQTRLDTVQESIELEKGQLKMLDQQTSLATIDVSIKTKGAAAKPVDEGTDWGVRDAFDDAAHAFVDSFSNGLIGIAGNLPGLLILAGIALGGRAAWKRRQSHQSNSTQSTDTTTS